jgi:hypothetical protein
MDTERTITVVGQTLAGMRAILNSRAYREHEPAILVGPFKESGGLTCVIKRMEDHDGKRLPDELNRGTLRVTKDVDGVRVKFDLGEFPDPAMFWRAAGDIVTELQKTFTVRGWLGVQSPTGSKLTQTVRLNHTSGPIQPGEYEVDETGALAIKGADTHHELLRGLIGQPAASAALGDGLSAKGGVMGDELESIKNKLLDFELNGGVTPNQRKVIGAALDRHKSYAIGKRDAIRLLDVTDLHSRLDALPTIGAKAEIGQPPEVEGGLVAESPAPLFRSSPQVFLSYAREDIDAARRLFNDLRNAGVKVWFDKESLVPGQRWKSTIKQAIRDSDFFLALLSAKSLNKTGYVQKELKEALEVFEEYPSTRIFIIPARLDDCHPTDDQLQELDWANMFPDWEEGLARIMRAMGLQK